MLLQPKNQVLLRPTIEVLKKIEVLSISILPVLLLLLTTIKYVLLFLQPTIKVSSNNILLCVLLILFTTKFILLLSNPVLQKKKRVLHVLLRVLLLSTTQQLTTQHVLQKKKFNIESSNPRLRLLLLRLLLLLLTMESNVVAAGTLEGIKLSFHPHISRYIKTFHLTLNVPYEMDLFDSEINFIFKDGASKTRLKNNAQSLLRAHCIENIKRECAMIYPDTKKQSLKVNKLFGDRKMSYLLKNGTRPDIIRVSDLKRAIHTNLKNPVYVCTTKNCADIYLSCSSDFPSCDGVIDDLNMDKVYRIEQSRPRPTKK